MKVTEQRGNLFVGWSFSSQRFKMSILLVHRRSFAEKLPLLVGSYVEGGKVCGPAITTASAYVYSLQLLLVK